MNKIKLLIASSLTLAMLSGCSTYSVEKIGIPYESMQGVNALTTAKTVKVSVQVNDIRANRSKVGDKKNRGI